MLLHFSSQIGASVLLYLLTSLGNAQSTDQTPLIYSSNNTNSCDEACTSLASLLGDKIHYHHLPATLFSEYFSVRQQEVRPRCLALPTSAQDVSEIMKVVSAHECTFAAKSGGHAMFAGASSAPDGITIDLKLLNGVEISEDRETVFVGGGGFLGGVGGFLLGGGISYVSRKYGWGADNVRNFEVVLANGSISNINYQTHPDLYWALRGGGANFGIVTRFDLETHPQGLAWGDFNGMLVSDIDSRADLLGVVPTPKTTFLSSKIKMFNALAWIGCKLGYCSDVDTYVGQLWRTLEVSKDDPYLQVYGYLCMLPWMDVIGFHMIDGLGRKDVDAYKEVTAGRKVLSDAKTAAMSVFADDLTKTSGGFVTTLRSSYSTLTLKQPTLEVMKSLHDMFLEEFGAVRRMEGVIASLPLMFITKDDVLHMAKNGGNPLGLKVEDCPLLLINAAFSYPTIAEEEMMIGASKRFIARATEMGKEKGVYHDYKYMNYAAEWQDVFVGYGEENRRRLREIQRKYDEKDVFRRLQAGYFKV